jgi:hypothetical protein
MYADLINPSGIITSLSGGELLYFLKIEDIAFAYGWPD